MATIAKMSSGKSAAGSINYALGKDKELKANTDKWFEDHHLERPYPDYRAVAMGGTNGIDPEIAKEQFAATRSLFNQDQQSNQCLRIIQSFDCRELNALNRSDWQRANDLGVELAQHMYPHNQAAVYTHLDNENHVLHNHIIINKVSFETGKKFHEPPRTSIHLAREINDQIAEREGWHVLEPVHDRISEAEKALVKKKEYSYMRDLRERVNAVMEDPSVSSYEALRDGLAHSGIEVRDRGGDWFSFHFRSNNGALHTVRSKRLGEDYSKERIIHELENRSRARQVTVVKPEQQFEHVSTRATAEIRSSTRQRTESVAKQIRQSNQRISERLREPFIRLETAVNRFAGRVQGLGEKIRGAFEKRLKSRTKSVLELMKQRNKQHDITQSLLAKNRAFDLAQRAARKISRGWEQER